MSEKIIRKIGVYQEELNDLLQPKKISIINTFEAYDAKAVSNFF